MKLSELLHDTGIKYGGTTDNTEEPEITGVCCDSRQVRPGNLFLCIKGNKSDGADFAEEARSKGAVVIRTMADGGPLTAETAAMLAARLYDHPDRRMALIGVTGTNGKTTTTWMIRQVLAHMNVGCGLIGTVAYETSGVTAGAEPAAVKAERTTPQPDLLYRLLSTMEKNGLRACAMEVSSQGLALNRVTGLEFQYGVFTNLTEDHLDFHGTMEAYYQAKKALFRQVKGISFINVDDARGERLYRELKAEHKLCRSVSLKNETADVYGRVAVDDGKFRITIPRSGVAAELALPGCHNCENALMTWAVCSAVMEQRAAEGIARVKRIPGRFEPVENHRGRRVFVDYAHTPDALEHVLNTARPLVKPGGRLICVFGCGGDRDREKRPLMGEVSGRLADYTVVTSDNPRSEEPGEIAAQIEEGLLRVRGSAYEIQPDRKKAIEKALTLCESHDIVIIAGKGHETTQTIGEEVIPFDDRAIAEEILRK